MTYPTSLIVAVLLLWAPLWVLRSRGARLTGFEQRSWPGGRHALLATLDALRASAGAWLLLRAVPNLPPLELMGRWQDATAFAAVLLVGLAVQTLAWKDEDFVLAPVAYVLGVAAAVAHPIVLVITLPLALGAALALRAWAGGLLAGGLGLAGVGLVVEQQDWRLGLLVGLSFCATVILSLLAGRHLGWVRQ